MSDKQRPRRQAPPAISAEARENQVIAYAVDEAEKRIRNGTASSQIICHYLKMGSTTQRIEKEILEKQKELITAKTESIKSAQNSERLYAEAIAAMGLYTIKEDEDDDYEDY